MRLTFFCKLDWGSYIIFIAKTTPKKIGALIRSMKFLSPRLLCISINLPYGHAWNTVVTSGLVALVATWNCQISYKKGYAGLSVLHMLTLLNPCLITFSIAITLVDIHLNWLNWFHLLFLEGGLLVIQIHCIIFLSPFLNVTRMSMPTVFFLALQDSGILWLQNPFL